MLTALVRLRGALQAAGLPLEIPGVAEQRTARAEMVDQLEDYVIPRLMTIDAPLLTVVGGSTGAGKSTLVNSLVGRRVTEPGVLRPTTRSPVLVHHPDDAHWFGQDRLLPDLERVTRPTNDPAALQLVAAEHDAGRPGDPRRTRHRLGRGAQPHPGRAAAGRRRPLAVRHLRRPVRRPGAVGLPPPGRRPVHRGGDRARPHARGRDPDRLHPPRADAGQPRAQGLAAVHGHRGTVSTTTGCCPPTAVADIRGWLESLAEDADARAAVVRQTLEGAVRTLTRRSHEVADAAAEQVAAVVRLREDVDRSYDAAIAAVAKASADGTLLRGEVLARWQEFVGTGELLKSLENRVGWVRDRIVNAVKGKPQQAQRVTVAVESGLETLILEHAEAAAERAEASWQSLASGQALLGRGRRGPRPGLARLPSPRRARRSATGRPTCWRWCAPRARTSARRRGSSPTASTVSRWR